MTWGASWSSPYRRGTSNRSMRGSSTGESRTSWKGLPFSKARASLSRYRPPVAFSRAPMASMVGATAATSSVSPAHQGGELPVVDGAPGHWPHPGGTGPGFPPPPHTPAGSPPGGWTRKPPPSSGQEQKEQDIRFLLQIAAPLSPSVWAPGGFFMRPENSISQRNEPFPLGNTETSAYKKGGDSFGPKGGNTPLQGRWQVLQTACSAQGAGCSWCPCLPGGQSFPSGSPMPLRWRWCCPSLLLSAGVYWWKGGLDLAGAWPYLLGGAAGGFLSGKVFHKVPLVWLRRGLWAFDPLRGRPGGAGAVSWLAAALVGGRRRGALGLWGGGRHPAAAVAHPGPGDGAAPGRGRKPPVLWKLRPARPLGALSQRPGGEKGPCLVRPPGCACLRSGSPSGGPPGHLPPAQNLWDIPLGGGPAGSCFARGKTPRRINRAPKGNTSPEALPGGLAGKSTKKG